MSGRVERARARGGISRRILSGKNQRGRGRRVVRNDGSGRFIPSLPHGCKQCVRAVRIGAENREGGSCGGGFPAGGVGGAGRRTVASLPSVSIETAGAAVPAAGAVSSAPRWRGCDQSDRWRRKRRARGERGVGTGAPASLLELLLPQRASPSLLSLCPLCRPFLPIFQTDGVANERN